MIGLKDYYNYFPKELSGGMRQRGSIARALTFAGDIMLFDEPFKSLDIKLRFELLDLMRKLKEEKYKYTFCNSWYRRSIIYMW